jgi:hypothetical protein
MTEAMTYSSVGRSPFRMIGLTPLIVKRSLFWSGIA